LAGAFGGGGLEGEGGEVRVDGLGAGDEKGDERRREQRQVAREEGQRGAAGHALAEPPDATDAVHVPHEEKKEETSHGGVGFKKRSEGARIGEEAPSTEIYTSVFLTLSGKQCCEKNLRTGFVHPASQPDVMSHRAGKKKKETRRSSARYCSSVGGKSKLRTCCSVGRWIPRAATSVATSVVT
jgi:hypothetical protein